jgi:hypothetical protein
MNGNALRINSPESWMTLVSSPELIRDIKNATNDQLSLHAAAKEVCVFCFSHTDLLLQGHARALPWQGSQVVADSQTRVHHEWVQLARPKGHRRDWFRQDIAHPVDYAFAQADSRSSYHH